MNKGCQLLQGMEDIKILKLHYKMLTLTLYKPLLSRMQAHTIIIHDHIASFLHFIMHYNIIWFQHACFFFDMGSQDDIAEPLKRHANTISFNFK